MTVIAGASLFSGVMLLADCRATIQTKGRPDRYHDVVQKLFPLTTSSAIGFAGDIRTAAFLIVNCLHQLQKRPRRDAVGVLQWLPRFLRSSYLRFDRKHGAAPVAFLVGSVIPGRPNVISRRRAAELLQAIAFGPTRTQRNFVPDILIETLKVPPEQEQVELPGTCAGMLYSLQSPDFVPRFYSPLDYAAIGSGQGAIKEISAVADWLFAGMPGTDMVEALALTQAVSEFAAAEGIDSVGGMFPCIKIDHRGIGLLGNCMGTMDRAVSLRFDAPARRWVQRNEKNGKKVPLLYPWEIDPRSLSLEQRFDDWADAVRAFNSSRLRRRI